jgi:SRSO17 transposase
MDVAQIRALKPRLDNYLARFSDCFTRCDTREHLAVYVGGQLSDLAQKSVEPIALAAGIPPRTLQEFLARYKWDEDALRRRLHHTVAREHAYPHSIGLIDETSDPKKGVQTPGVQRQHCGAVGKKDNCIVTVHTAVSHLFLARVHQELRGEKPGADGVPGADGDVVGGEGPVAPGPVRRSAA